MVSVMPFIFSDTADLILSHIFETVLLIVFIMVDIVDDTAFHAADTTDLIASSTEATVFLILFQIFKMTLNTELRIYEGKLEVNHYGKTVPKSAKGTGNIGRFTASTSLFVAEAEYSSGKRKLEKLETKFKDQLLELKTYEEKIHHYADMMIQLDLDDGVKVNYDKLQDVLAKIK